jgi:predicted ABC-type transport system involved in lysophospholipase L1 biosynthesis ATPase subunit
VTTINFQANGSLLQASAVQHSFQLDGQEVSVLRDVNLTVERGCSVALVGPSGSGKSTLLGILGALEQPAAGKVHLMGHEISNLGEDRLADIRNRYIGFIFQFFYLLPNLTALENVMLPAGLGVSGKEDVPQRALDLLVQTGLRDKVRNKPRQLSGGEQQRVAIARALINEPALILADEPTGNLDAKTSEAIVQLLWDMHKKIGAGLVCVTHDADVARRADRILELRDGVLVNVR